MTWVNGKYRVSAGGQHTDFAMPVTFAPSTGALLNLLTPTDLGTTGKFRGVLRVLRPDGALMIVNKLPMESYLRGVVPHEMGYSWPAEALKAQACAARAYAQRARKPNESFDVYCTVRDQTYAGASGEHRQSDLAVSATAGIVPTYDGQVISAFYFSTSGGHTENIENVVADRAGALPQGRARPLRHLLAAATSGRPNSRAPARLASAALGGSVSGSLRAIYVLQRGVSPRIVLAAVVGSKGTQFLHGSILRAKLDLKDSWAFFRSMSISPAAADHAGVAPDGSVLLSGKLFQAAPAGATVTLHAYYDKAWHTQSVATTRASLALGSGYTAKYSAYQVTLKPAQTTTYYFTYADQSYVAAHHRHRGRLGALTAPVTPAPRPRRRREPGTGAAPYAVRGGGPDTVGGVRAALRAFPAWGRNPGCGKGG